LQGGHILSEHVHKERPVPQKEAPIQAAPSLGEAEAPSTMDPYGLTPAKIMQLQKTHGNRAVQGMIQMMQKSSTVAQRVGEGTAVAQPPTSTVTPTPAPLTPTPIAATPALAPLIPAPLAGLAPVVGPAPLPTPIPAPVIPRGTPLEQRKQELDAERDSSSQNLAQTAYLDIQAQVEQGLLAFLLTDKKAAGLRQSIAQTAKAKVEEEIDADLTTTDQAKADAKKFAAQTAEASDATRTTLSGYAKEVSLLQVLASSKDELVTNAKTIYNKTTPNIKVPLEVQKAKATAEAQKKVQEMARRMITEFSNKGKIAAAEKAKADVGFLNVKVEIGGAGKKELDKRHSMEDNLIEDTAVEGVFRKDLFQPIMKAVVLKFGVGRRGFRRSKELNEFRQKLKDSAREQARADIDANIDSDALMTDKGAKTKEYYAMVAKTKAVALAKVSVDSVMETEAEAIVNQVLPEDSVKGDIKHAGKTTAYTIARTNALDLGKIKTAGLTGAKAKAASMLEAKKAIAVNEARKITKGDKEADVQTPDAAKNASITADVQEQVTDDDIAGKAIKESVEADSLNTGFSKLGKLIDLATPNSGDSSSLDVEVKIPISQGGGYFLFGFGGEAEREDGELKVSTQLTFGAGFTTFGFDANFRMGLFLESQGKNTSGAMNLLSYGLYREMRSSAPAGADFFWGQGGKSGDTKLQEAEKWASMIEEQDMGDGNYVDVGLITKVAMEANAGVAKFSAEMAYKRLKHYEKEAAVAGQTPPARVGEGETRNVLEAATEVEVKFGKDAVAFGLEGSMTFVGGSIRSLEIEASGNVPSQFGEESGEFTRIAAKIVTASIGSGKNLIGILKTLKSKEEKDKKKKVAGTLMDGASDAIFLDDNFESVGNSLVEQLQGDETVNDTIRSWIPGEKAGASAIEQANKIGLSNSLKLALSFSKEWNEAGAGGDWEIALTASQVKSMSVDAEVVAVEIEKAKRLGKIALGKKDGVKKVSGGLAGLEG
jgi:hypothetical protein